VEYLQKDKVDIDEYLRKRNEVIVEAHKHVKEEDGSLAEN
jgi:hypothetical protein